MIKLHWMIYFRMISRIHLLKMLYVRIVSLLNVEQEKQHSPCAGLLKNLLQFWKFSFNDHCSILIMELQKIINIKLLYHHNFCQDTITEIEDIIYTSVTDHVWWKFIGLCKLYMRCFWCQHRNMVALWWWLN